MNAPIPIPPPLAGRPFSVAEALELGLSSNRLRTPDLARPFHGVREDAGGDGSLRARARAYQARMAPNEFFSHSTAALLFGVPLPSRLESQEELHVSVLAPAAPPQAVGVAGHLLQHARTTTFEEFRVAGPEAVWCQLAGTLPLNDLVAAGDYLITGPDPYHGAAAFTTSAELAAAVSKHPRRRGIRTARLAIELTRAGPRSRPESHLRVLIVRARLPEPQINLPVRVLDGTQRLIDLAYPELKLGLEYEGDWHRTNPKKWASDIVRREELLDVDWEIIRIDKGQLYDRPEELLTRIRLRMRARADHAR
ncbi:MAG TPA: hypothetical protein VIJ18_16540 [Microbacteriaceae bacterium]